MVDEQPGTAERFDFALDDAPAARSEERKRSYSLLLLFYITTIAAFLVAVCRLAFVDTQWNAQTFAIGCVISGGLGVLMAMVIGYFIGRTWVSTFLGLFAGMICGLVGLLMTFVQPTHYETASYLLCAGCWFMSLLAIVANRVRQ